MEDNLCRMCGEKEAEVCEDCAQVLIVAGDMVQVARIKAKMDIAQERAIKALAGYDYAKFGNFASQWVALNGLLPRPANSPFRTIVSHCREVELVWPGLDVSKENGGGDNSVSVPKKHIG